MISRAPVPHPHKRPLGHHLQRIGICGGSGRPLFGLADHQPARGVVGVLAAPGFPACPQRRHRDRKAARLSGDVPAITQHVQPRQHRRVLPADARQADKRCQDGQYMIAQLQRLDRLRGHPGRRKPKLGNRLGDVLGQIPRHPPRHATLLSAGVAGGRGGRADGQRLGVHLAHPTAAPASYRHRQPPPGSPARPQPVQAPPLGGADRGLRRGHRLIAMHRCGVEADHRVVVRDPAGLQLDDLHKRHRHPVGVLTAAA